MRDMKNLIRQQKFEDWGFAFLGVMCTLIGLIVLGTLLYNLFTEGANRLSWQFLTSMPSPRPARAGIYLAALGSVMICLVTALSAVPLGIAAAVYLEEYARKNWLTSIIEVNITNLAGVPSIIYGLMSIGLFIYTFGMGRNVLVAGLTLAFLILPIILVATREALRAVPNGVREAAYALGATKWQVVSHHLIPCSLSGITTGTIIALSRALGESAPLLVVGVIGFTSVSPKAPFQSSFPFVNFSWLFDRFSVLPTQIFDWTSRPQKEFHENAAAAAIILIFITLTLNAVAVFIRYRARRRMQW